MANPSISSGSFPSSSCSGAVVKGIGLSNTIHSDVAPILPLPSLPIFCGSVDSEIRLFENSVAGEDKLWYLDRNDILSQSATIAELLRNTDVSYIKLRDDSKSVSVDCMAPLELHNQVLRYNPRAFHCDAPSSEYVGQGTENGWSGNPPKSSVEPAILHSNKLEQDSHGHRKSMHISPNHGVSKRKVKLKKGDINNFPSVTQHDPMDIQDTIIENICHLMDELCAKAEISSDDREEAEFFSLPASDLVMFVSEISSIRSKKLLHLVPGDYFVKLLRVMDHQIHRAEGLSADDGDHSNMIVCALEAIHVILAIMANSNMPKMIYKEEIIERVLEFSKHQLNDVMLACDPSYRALHNPGEFAVPEDDGDDEKDIESGSAIKRRRSTKPSRYKKSVSNRVPGKINSILQKLCTILGLWKDLLLTERLSDSCLLQLVKTCFTTFMVDNIQLLQLKSISLLNGIFFKYIQHRVHIIDETVQLLWRLPISKRAQRAYHLPDEEQRQIQMVSALLIHFVHSSANIPDPLRQATTGSSLLDISVDSNQLAKCYESVTETCCLFWSRVIQRLTATNKNQDTSETKIMMENLVCDLLTTLNLPEYPATIPILEVLCVLLLQNTVFKAKDVSVRLLAIDLLGVVATRLKQDSVFCRRNPFLVSFKVDDKSDIDLKDGKLACSLCSDGKTDRSILKCEDCHRLFHSECIGVVQHQNSGKAWNCPICVCQKQLRLLLSYSKSQSLDKENKMNENSKPSSLITNVETVRQMLLNCLHDDASSDDIQLFVRWFYLCLWFKDNSTFQQDLHYHLAKLKSNLIFSGNNFAMLNRDSLRTLTSILGQNSSFCRGFDKILHMILASLMEASPVIRAKALRAVSIIVEADPEVLCDQRVQSAVEGRFCDSAISVREAALELVGRHIASHPDVGLKYFEKVAERIKDTGVSVRKRAIKIIRDMCTSNTNFSEFSSACIEIISRVSDDESSIQDLVCKTFYEFWFEEPSGPCPQYYNDGSSVPLEVAKKTEQIVEMSKKMTSHQLLVTVLKRNLALDFFPQAAKAAGISPVTLASVRKRCELMCQCLLEKILQAEETKGNDMETCTLPYVLMLHSFCSVDPALCVPISDPSQFVVTLQSYLKTQADNRGTAQLLENIIIIIDSVLPLIRKLPKSVVDELEQDLKSMIVRHPFLTVVHASIKCLCSLSKIVGHGATVVEYLINAFFKRLDAQGSDDNKQLLSRSLFCLGLLLRYGNSLLAGSPNRDPDVLKCLELFKRFLPFEDFSVNVRSLQALGYVLIARPELMLEKEIGHIIEKTLSSKTNVRLKMQSLQNMYEYLLDAETQLGGDKSPDIIQSVPVAAGAGDTNICGGIVQLYWDIILKRCLDSQGQIRQTALKIVEIVLRQGLVHPITSVPYLIALETDPDEMSSKLAHHLLSNMNDKYPAFVESRLGDGLQLSFVFIELIRASPSDSSHSQARLGVSRVYKLLRGNRASRNKFISSIIRKFDVPCNSNPPFVSFLIYCTEILALLPFTSPDEPLCLIYTINRIIQVRAGALEATMKGFILHLSQTKQPPSPDDTLKIKVDCLAATALQLLLKLKRHMKIVYSLNDARCQAFSPNEPPKPGEALSKQTIPLDISGTSTEEPSSEEDLVLRYQEFKNALKEDTEDYATYTANIRKKRTTPLKMRSGRVADEDECENDEDWTSGNRKVSSKSRKTSTRRRR